MTPTRVRAALWITLLVAGAAAAVFGAVVLFESTDQPVASGALMVPAAHASATGQSTGETTLATSPVPTSEPVAAPTVLPTPTAVTLPTPVPVTEFTLSFSGDILSHTPVIARAFVNGSDELLYDYRPMFAQVQNRLRGADIAICVLETPLSPDNSDLTGYPTFNAPGDLADALVEAGFDGCSTASNHSYDRGETGLVNTLGELDRVGLAHAGMARSSTEANTVRFYEAGGARIAHLSFTYGLNGFVLPDGKPWLVDVTETSAVLAKAAEARAAGADVVVLMLQWGNEYQIDPTVEQLALARELTASPDIDLIVGNHAHVVQPIDVVNDKVVVYGLGNFLSNQPAPGYPARTQDGMVVEVRFAGQALDGWAVDAVTVVPTWVDKSTYTVLPVNETLADTELEPWLRMALETSLDRTTEAVGRLNIEDQLDLSFD